MKRLILNALCQASGTRDFPQIVHGRLLGIEQTQSVTWVKMDLRQNDVMSLGVARIVAKYGWFL
ncbi:MAG: hypothetical protein JNL67_16085 [Planctomycetaceae bacterium]|nr:hypothetical protein [Planctomycetaceae bacterium]